MEVKLVEYNKRLEEKASTDPLTGLYNRGKIMDVLDGLSSKGEVFSLCICDIDFFKNVNDNYGHNAGDMVLKNVANIFAKNMKNLGYVARWGGEEFIMIFPGMNGDEACASVYSLQDQVRKSTVKYEDFEIKVTLTYGLTEYDFNSQLDRNIKDADDKLYIGKDKGRNVVIY